MTTKQLDQAAIARELAARNALIGNRDATSAPLGTVAPQIVAPVEDHAAASKSQWEGYGFADFSMDFVNNETFVGSFLRGGALEGLADPTWKFPALDSPEWLAATEGIPEDKWTVLGRARSAAQLNTMSFKVRDELETAQRMMEYGVVPFFAANIFNPESVLLSMSTGGLSWVQKGNRLSRAMKFGAVAAGENVTQEAAIASLSATRDGKDVYVAAAAGLILGGTFGAFSRGMPGNAKVKFADTLHNDIDKMSQTQAADAGIGPRPVEPSPARVNAEAEARLVDVETNSRLDAEEARLRAIVDHPTASADRLTHTYSDIDARLQASRKLRDEDSAIVTADQAKQVDDESRNMARKDDANKYAQDRIRETGGGAGDIFPAIRKQAQGNVEARRANAATRLTVSTELTRTLQGALDKANSIRGAEVDLGLLQGARKAATNTRQRVALVPERMRAQLSQRLDEADGELAATLPDRPPQLAGGAPLEQPTGPGFGADSGGAARLDIEIPPSHFAEVDMAGAPTRLLRFLPRFDYGSVLRDPRLSPAIRDRVSRYLGDSVPAVGEVSRIGATETAARLRDQHLTKVYQVYETAFGDFLKEAGLNRFKTVSRKARRAFGSLVTQEIKGNDTGSAAAKIAAQRMRQVYADIGNAAKEAKVKGFEDFTPDAYYVPRVPDRPKIARNSDTYERRTLVAAIKEAVSKGYRDLDLQIDDALLSRLADGYFARLNDLSLGIENEALAGLRLTDVDQIAGTLRLANVDEATIADTVLRLRNGLQKTEGDGTVRYSKSRTTLDEDHPIRVYNVSNAQYEDKTLRDLLFHDDAETLFQTYNHSMSGWIAMAKEAGIKSKADHQKLTDSVRRELQPKEGVRVAEALDDAYKFTIGQPMQDTGGRWAKGGRRLGRALRDYQFARVMNMVGFANISDAAAYLAPQYLKFIARHMPDMGRMFTRMQNGQLEHKLARQLEEWTSGGTDSLHNKLFAAHDDELDSGVTKLEHAIRVAAQVTERNPFGIGPLTTMNQRLTEIAISQRLVDNIMGEAGTLGKLDVPKWNKLGIDEVMIARIRKEFEGGAVEIDGGKLKSLDFAAFKDTEARDALVAAIHRESRRLVQEEDFSDTYPFMHSAIGKVLIQFRRFGLVSYTKQFYRAAADRDIETASRLTVQVSLGSVSYAAQMYLYSLTKGDEAQEWRDKYLTWERILFGGIARAGMFSLTPALFETLWQGVTGTEGVFSNTRTSGLASTALAGVPVIDFFSRTFEAAGDIVQNFREDRQFDQKDFANLRSVLPWQNMIVVKQLMDVIQQTIPEDEGDDDPEVAAFPVFGDIRQKTQ